MIYAYVYGYGGLRDEGDQKHATTVMVTTRGEYVQGCGTDTYRQDGEKV